jgi:hypothetical protein
MRDDVGLLVGIVVVMGKKSDRVARLTDALALFAVAQRRSSLSGLPSSRPS